MNEIKLSKKAKALKLGIYEHYKSNKYQVLGAGVSPYGGSPEGRHFLISRCGRRLTWVRPLKMFLEKVTIDGIKKPRFRYIGKSI